MCDIENCLHDGSLFWPHAGAALCFAVQFVVWLHNIHSMGLWTALARAELCASVATELPRASNFSVGLSNTPKFISNYFRIIRSKDGM